MELACLDGNVGPVAEATIPATDQGLIRGDGVFEVIRLYEGRPFALAEHLARLQNSADNLRLPVDVEELRRDVGTLLEEAGAHDGLLRIVVTRGGRRLLLTEPMPKLPSPMRLGYVTYSPTHILDGVKSLSYAANMLATRLAQERGFHEALLLTPEGRVLEAPTASLFWVSDGHLLTPPLEDHILASITRDRIMKATDAREAECTPDALAGADEAFLASTVREALPVSAVEDVTLPDEGPVTAEVGRTLRGIIAAELAAEVGAES